MTPDEYRKILVLPILKLSPCRSLRTIRKYRQVREWISSTSRNVYRPISKKTSKCLIASRIIAHERRDYGAFECVQRASRKKSIRLDFLPLYSCVYGDSHDDSPSMVASPAVASRVVSLRRPCQPELRLASAESSAY